MKTICVYCSSSDVIDPIYFEFARTLGAGIAQRGDTLVMGGTNTGLMKAVADAAQKNSGSVIGIIPEIARGTPYVYPSNETVFVSHLRERKAQMEKRSDVFVALPGGFGTLEELLEILTYKQMQLHNKPVIIANVNGFYDPLLRLFEHLFAEKFASAEHHRQLYYAANDVGSIFSYIESYQPSPIPLKWF